MNAKFITKEEYQRKVKEFEDGFDYISKPIKRPESIIVKMKDGSHINAIKCSECEDWFEEKDIVIVGDFDTCDDCLCPE
jgi:6-phosphogluconate dehydrogenase